MINKYKKFGVSGASDIVSGLLDMFYVEPGFEVESYRVVVEEAADESKGAVSYEAYDPEDFRPYSVPVRNAGRPVSTDRTGVSTDRTDLTMPTPAERPAFGTIVNDWADLLEEDSDQEDGQYEGPGEGNANEEDDDDEEDEEDEGEEFVGKSCGDEKSSPSSGLCFPRPVYRTVSAVSALSAPPGFSGPPGFPPPGFEAHPAPAAPPAVYRHLVLDPRTLPVPPDRLPPSASA